MCNKCKALESSRNHSTPIHGKTIFHKTGSGAKKGWGPCNKIECPFHPWVHSYNKIPYPKYTSENHLQGQLKYSPFLTNSRPAKHTQHTQMVDSIQVVLVVKESACQCRRSKRRGFDPWVRKIPLEEHMATQSSIFAW